MTDAVESSGKSPQELSHEILLEAKAALEGGNIEEALKQARLAYEACPNEYPANYNALSTAQVCMDRLGLEEEAGTLRDTMQKLLMEHDTKPHAEGEARTRHPLKKDKKI